MSFQRNEKQQLRIASDEVTPTKHRGQKQLPAQHIAMGAPPPNPRDLSLFFRQNGLWVCFQGTVFAAPSPFRPLSRSLGLLPSIALSRPTQVWLVSIKPIRRSTQKQRMVNGPKFPCLSRGVQSRL
jgi:hypothetical protein